MNNQEKVAPTEREAIEYVKGIKGFYTHLGIFLIIMIAFTWAWGLDNPLVPWGALGWGAGLIVHGLSVYEVINFFGPQWERRQIEKRLGRDP